MIHLHIVLLCRWGVSEWSLKIDRADAMTAVRECITSQSRAGVVRPVFAYICPMDADTSGHNRSISSFNLCKAKLCKAGSGSDRKPTKPAAEVSPTMLTAVVATELVEGLPSVRHK
jgi:hypothetical protein